MNRRQFLTGAAMVAAMPKVVKAVENARATATWKDLGKEKILPPGKYDSHVHVWDRDEPDPDALVKGLREAGFVGACIFSKTPNPPVGIVKDTRLRPEQAMDNVIAWASGSKTVYPFYWIDPAAPEAGDLVDMAVEKGIYGFKVIRNSGKPCDEKSLPVYAKIAKYGKPVTFHSGILWDGLPSSDNFRPGNWEPMLLVPHVRFALAHVSWPWYDECIAVFGKLLNAMNCRGTEVPEMFIDTTPGTPKCYRRDVLKRVYEVGYDLHDHVMFGTDNGTRNYRVPWTTDWVKTDAKVYEELALPESEIDSIYRTALQRYLFGGDNSNRAAPTPDGTIRRNK